MALLPELPDEGRDLGLIYLRNGDPYPAARLLEEYVEQPRQRTPQRCYRS